MLGELVATATGTHLPVLRAGRQQMAGCMGVLGPGVLYPRHRGAWTLRHWKGCCGSSAASWTLLQQGYPYPCVPLPALLLPSGSTLQWLPHTHLPPHGLLHCLLWPPSLFNLRMCLFSPSHFVNLFPAALKKSTRNSMWWNMLISAMGRLKQGEMSLRPSWVTEQDCLENRREEEGKAS